MDTREILEAIADFLDKLGYEKADGTRYSSHDVQATVEMLASELEQSRETARADMGGLSLGREEGEGGPLVLRIAFFDAEIETVAPEGNVILTALRIRAPGVDETRAL